MVREINPVGSVGVIDPMESVGEMDPADPVGVLMLGEAEVVAVVMVEELLEGVEEVADLGGPARIEMTLVGYMRFAAWRIRCLVWRWVDDWSLREWARQVQM